MFRATHRPVGTGVPGDGGQVEGAPAPPVLGPQEAREGGGQVLHHRLLLADHCSVQQGEASRAFLAVSKLGPGVWRNGGGLSY